MNRFPDVKATEILIPPELKCSANLPETSLQLRESFGRLQKEFEQTLGLWSCRQQVQVVQSMLADEEFLPVLLQTAVCDDINFQETGQEQGILSIPINMGTGENFVAFAKIHSSMAKAYTSIAKLLSESMQLEWSQQQLENQNEELLHQITMDMEELTFLRQLHSFLELKPDQPSEIDELLKVVANQVKSTWIGFVPFSETQQTDRVLELPEFCLKNAGLERESPQMDHRSLQQLVFHFGKQETIVVKNGINRVNRQQPEIPEFVDSLLICPVEKSNHKYGWLVAVNRLHETNVNRPFTGESYPCEFGSVEAGLLTSAAAMLATHFSNLNLLAANKELLTDVVRCLVAAIESKDAYTCGHSERVARFGRRIGQQLGLDEENLERIYLSGLLHDVGKIGISDSILLKATPPTEQEFEAIKKHPEDGWKILQSVRQLENILAGVLFHHERVDGHGYPDGLIGDDIPTVGKILAVADAFDAMTSSRPYRKGMPSQKAYEILQTGAGTQWDTEIVEAFLSIAEEIDAIKLDYHPEPAPQRVQTTTRRSG